MNTINSPRFEGPHSSVRQRGAYRYPPLRYPFIVVAHHPPHISRYLFRYLRRRWDDHPQKNLVQSRQTLSGDDPTSPSERSETSISQSALSPVCDRARNRHYARIVECGCLQVNDTFRQGLSLRCSDKLTPSQVSMSTWPPCFFDATTRGITGRAPSFYSLRLSSTAHSPRK